MMMWVMSKLALFNHFHISARSLEVQTTYMLTIVRFLLSESLRVMNYALPLRRMLLEVIWGMKDLCTRIKVLVLNLCKHPIGMLWFQKEAPFQNSTPLDEVTQSASPKWCSYRNRICGGHGQGGDPCLVLLLFWGILP